MTGTLTMYDTITNSQFPANLQAAAAYVDGEIGNQPNYSYIVRAFPKADHASIALNSANNADFLDIENGAATVGEAVDWYERQVDGGAARPGFYASASLMEEQVVPVIRAAGFDRSKVRLWAAHYGDGEHICGPKSCGLVSIDMDGTQWTDNALGRDLDASLLLGTFFPLPASWTYGPPQNLKATGGDTTVKLTWDAPALAPTPPDSYSVYIYRGTMCSKATQVGSYPRDAKASPWQGGSLPAGRTYTAHVVAEGPDGTRIRPFTYGSVTFRTG